MTCEIVVMNRHAIVLAADSAVTLSGKQRTAETYFKSVNKVFQISKNKPVGMMVYDAGSLQLAPWELIAKEFRDHLGDKEFDTLDGYGEALFDFIGKAKDIFPDEYQEKVFQMEGCNAIESIISELVETKEFQALDPAGYEAFFDAKLAEYIHTCDGQPHLDGFDDGDIVAATKKFQQPLCDFVTERAIPGKPELWAEFAIKTAYKVKFSMARSGIVIAGYGKKDYFPGYREYNCWGNILGKTAVKVGSQNHISYQNSSGITGFAVKEMVHTFLFGVGETVHKSLINKHKESLNKLAVKLGVGAHANLDQLVEQASGEFEAEFTNEVKQNNFVPLSSIVSNLPVEDMIELAETMVRLESLKEKVTRPSQSIGGPVDVAVITRGEGLVWIKRKHYFDPSLNSRYFARQKG